jgi:hypothetical protein
MNCSCLKKFEGTCGLFKWLSLAALLLAASLVLFVAFFLKLPPQAQ